MSARVVLAASVAATVAMAVGLFVAGCEGDPSITDTPVYRTYGERIAAGDVPYRDFRVEYPPGALVAFVVPALLSSNQDSYDALFGAAMVFALAALAALLVLALEALRATPLRTAAAVAALLAGTALLGPFLLTRFDLYAAAVTLAAICAILHGRRRLGPALLGVAIATKLYPAVLLPLYLIRTWRSEGRAEALRGVALSLGCALAVYLPFGILAPEGVAQSVWRQLGRPLQIESLGAAGLLALHHGVGMPLGWASGSGSQNLTGSVSAAAAGLTTVAGLAALALVYVRFAEGETASGACFVRYGAAAIVAFVAFGKVASPQFLVWLLAVVVAVGGRRGAAATALLLAACGLTRMWFPGSYWELVRRFDTTASWLVLARDLVLVAVFAALLRHAARRVPARNVQQASSAAS